MGTSHTCRNLAIILGALAFIGIVLFAVPIIPFSYVEAYNVTVPYYEQEPYTVKFSYTITSNKTEPIGSNSNFTIEGGHYVYWDPYVPLGRDVRFIISASDTVNLYIFNSSQFSNYMNTSSAKPNEKELLEVSRGKIEYHVSSADTYYFVIYNLHSGFLGFEKKNVGIYSGLITAKWEEKVTKYRTETRYRNVTRYRTETHNSTITVKVTSWELITGSY